MLDRGDIEGLRVWPRIKRTIEALRERPADMPN
jgi:hypothetical protein